MNTASPLRRTLEDGVNEAETAVPMMEAVAAAWTAAVAVRPHHLETPVSDYCGQPRLHSQPQLLLC